MNWEQLLSKRRFNPNGNSSEFRSEFHKDYDKIIFSSAFRRLGRKTQVHPLSHYDHIHTRLTHSIEVGSVGRSLGLIVGNHLQSLNVLPSGITPQEIGAIVQAACLAHDIGNPPFGHAGEYAIRHWFKENSDKLCLNTVSERNDLEIFEGNAQGFRVVTKLENNYNNGGLRLTYATLGTLIKYPWYSNHSLATTKEKFNFFQAEKDISTELFNELGIQFHGNQYQRHPLSYLMEAADDICYKILDIEDAIEIGMFRYDDVSEIFTKLSGDKIFSDIGPNHAARRRIIPLRSNAIENLIQKCSEIFISKYELIISGNYGTELIKDISGVEAEGIKDAKKITEENIFLNRRKMEIEIGAYETLDKILSSFINAVNEFKKGEKMSFKSKRVIDLIGENNIKQDSTYYECYLRVADLVSGMTDNYATYLANQLSGRAL